MEDVFVLLFGADTTTGANNKNLLINGFEINTPNPKHQVRLHIPQNADEHVDADNGTLDLYRTNASNAVASKIYLGLNPTSVADATETSPLYCRRLFYDTDHLFRMLLSG